MKLVVGLGNPGLEYDRTRHNVGFEVVDRLARRTVDASRSIARSRFSGSVLETDVATDSGSEKVMYLKPLMYMNRSGQSVAEALRFYKLVPAKDLFVVVDDIALPCGTIRIRPDGSSGGHNGLADIEEKLGTSAYARCRIGIDAPGQVPQKDYVLGKFRPDQQTLVESALELAVQACSTWMSSGVEAAMNRFNVRSSPRESSPLKASERRLPDAPGP
ncbi:MAG: aminoacyl-tRNA hydrolase [Phycisphaerae bacterium]|nr:aminoacyl-tRNA hydrolase [Phycisphaerae bacterium]